MLFTSLLAFILAVFGTVSAAPMDVDSVVDVEPRSVDTSIDVGIGLLPREQSADLQAEIDRLEDSPFENDEAYVLRIMEDCKARWPNHNIFVYHKFRSFAWDVADRARALEATAVKHYLPLKKEYFGVVIFKTTGWLRNDGDGGSGNWRVHGDFDKHDDRTYVFRARS